MAVIPPRWLDCVVALGEPEGDGTHWMATGFFYVHVTGRREGHVRGKGYLVTARHVVAGRSSITLRVNPSAAEPAREFTVDLRPEPDGERVLVPDDATIDVAVIPVDLGRLHQQGMSMATFCSDTDVATRAELTTAGVSEGDGVFVLGFPMGDVGGARSFVIVRGGTIARIRDALAGQSDDLLVDCFVFPGNSGGPVVLRPELDAVASTRPQPRALLLGVVKSYASYQDIAVSQQTRRPRVVFEENTGLAMVHPIDLVVELARAHAEQAPDDESVTDQAGGATSRT